MTGLLQIKALAVAYDGVTALDGVDLAVSAGEIRALLGANGAGKTTLLKSIMGLVPATGGEILVDGTPVAACSPEARARLGVGYCPEGRRLFPGLTVGENLEVAAFADARERRRRMERVLTLFPQLGTRRGSLAWQLSGGQQQMLAIGRALMADPRLLLLDEPSVGLAGGLVSDLMERLRDVAAAGTGVLLAEQNAAAALTVAPNADVLRAGRIAWSGATKNLRNEVVDDVFLGG